MTDWLVVGLPHADLHCNAERVIVTYHDPPEIRQIDALPNQTQLQQLNI